MRGGDLYGRPGAIEDRAAVTYPAVAHPPCKGGGGVDVGRGPLRSPWCYPRPRLPSGPRPGATRDHASYPLLARSPILPVRAGTFTVALVLSRTVSPLVPFAPGHRDRATTSPVVALVGAGTFMVALRATRDRARIG